jgi:hypothetical protein
MDAFQERLARIAVATTGNRPRVSRYLRLLNVDGANLRTEEPLLAGRGR